MRKGSIALMVIIILIVSSFLGLLTMNYVRNLISFASNFYQYQKAFYLAKGGTELALTKVAMAGIGFEDKVSSGSVWSAALCQGDIQKNCSIEYTISARASEVGCQVSDVFAPGRASILPLFFDNRGSVDKETPFTGLIETDATKIYDQTEDVSVNSVSISGNNIGVGIILTKLDRTESDGIKQYDYEKYMNGRALNSGFEGNDVTNDSISQSIQEFLNIYKGGFDGEYSVFPIFQKYDNYLFMINNSLDSNAKFCLEFSDKDLLVKPIINIESYGLYGNREVVLRVNKRNSFPEFIINTITLKK